LEEFIPTAGLQMKAWMLYFWLILLSLY
jgi:hypothetical protein